jgi:hypothetical protein
LIRHPHTVVTRRSGQKLQKKTFSCMDPQDADMEDAGETD